MTDENDNDEKQENSETAEASRLLEVEADETAVNSGGRAPSRAKSRGSISDQRKVASHSVLTLGDLAYTGSHY